MKFARWTFLLAGIWGIVVLTPHYFLERFIATQHPPAITHPEYFYGFVGVGLAWQILFLIVATDPACYRGARAAGVVEKFSFASAVFALFLKQRVDAGMAGAATIDFLLAILFTIAFLKTARTGARQSSSPKTPSLVSLRRLSY